jgi:hypothetical protein
VSARASLGQLLKMWGSPDDIDPKKPPQLVVVTCMGERALWVRVGREDGEKTVYEKQDEAQP